MISAFEDMDMEIHMEEQGFEDGGMPAESSHSGDGKLTDGFISSADAFIDNPFESAEPAGEPETSCVLVQEKTVSDGAWEAAEEEGACPDTEGAEEESACPDTEGMEEENSAKVSGAENESEDKKRAEHEAAEARRKAEWTADCREPMASPSSSVRLALLQGSYSKTRKNRRVTASREQICWMNCR